MKKVIIVHGWDSSPEEKIHKLIKQELDARNIESHFLVMPNPLEPKIEEWVPFLKENVPSPDEQTYFVGHSIGCQTILRYLETLPENTKVAGVALLAGWLHLNDVAYEDEEDKEIAKPWLETPINWEKVKSHTNNFIAIASDNDPLLPLSDKDIFAEKLGAKVVVEHNKGHYREEDNINEVPPALLEFLK